MYFDKFPILEYIDKFSEEKKIRFVTDIIRRVKISSRVKNETSLFIKYNTKEGDTPESIAHRLYGDTQYFWVVMFANDVINPYYGFALNSQSLENYARKKYDGKYFYLVDENDEKKMCGITFAPDETIFSSSDIVDDFGTIQENYLVRARIVSHQPSFSRIFVDGGEHSYFNEGSLIGVIKGSTVQRAKIKKIESGLYGLSRFEKTTGEYIDSLSSIDDETPLGQTSDIHTIPVEFYETRLGVYLGISGDSNTDYSITNFEKEININEAQRQITLIDPKYLNDITGAFAEIMQA